MPGIDTADYPTHPPPIGLGYATHTSRGLGFGPGAGILATMRGTRRIGLIGGISWGATAQYYRYINLELRRRLGGHHSADMLIRSLDMHPLIEQANDVAAVERVFAEAGQGLSDGGAELLAVASFTGHRYVAPLRSLTLPLIDLVDCVGARLRAQRCQRVAVLATSFALDDRSLLGRLAEAAGVSLILPAADRYPVLDQIIFNELADQRISASSLVVLHEVLASQAAQGADALLLATTDFAPIRKQLETALPVLDAAEIHSEALVDAALS